MPLAPPKIGKATSTMREPSASAQYTPPWSRSRRRTLPRSVKPEAPARVEDDVVRPLQRVLAAAVVQPLHRAGGRVDASMRPPE
jgi:hypothetical protein